MDFVLREPCVDQRARFKVAAGPCLAPSPNPGRGRVNVTLSLTYTFNALMILSYVENVMLAAGTRHFYTIKHAENGSS